MGQASQAELQDLITVHTFYFGLLEKGLGHGVPIPAEIKKTTDAPAAVENVEQSVTAFKQWLDLLDLATTPPLVRDALKGLPGFTTAHSLLRYFTSKCSVRSGDRDKTDCIITYLFRNPQGTPPIWQRPEIDSSYLFISQAALAFEGDLYHALGDVQCESMAQEHVALLREFEFLYQELEEFRHFDQIMDSGIVQRVRELKQSLGKSFYHPDSLSAVAAWNDVFGRKFDVLFHDATKQIKTFAEHVQKEGGSIMARVEGDITVKQLSEIETSELLAEDYQYAQDEFRKLSRYQKAVDGKRPVRPAVVASRLAETSPAPPPPPRPVSVPMPEPDRLQPLAATVATVAASARAKEKEEVVAPTPVKTEVLAVPPSRAVHNSVQEGKIHSAREQIKEHVRGTNDPRVAAVVPVKKTQITLSPAEVEAYRADFGEEKSFRASYAALMRTVVAYLSRMIVEVDEYNQKAGSAYLWKPHADALGYLLATLEKLGMEAHQLMAVARARGLADKATALQASLDKVNNYAKTVAQTLQAADQHAGSQSS